MYTSKAKELETAIYTQKRLIAEHNDIIQSRRLTKPVHKKEGVEILSRKASEYFYRSNLPENYCIYTFGTLGVGIMFS